MDTQHFIFMGRTFTLREMQNISMTVHGLYQCEMAGYLKCELSTVKGHLQRIFIKLNYPAGINKCNKLSMDALENGFDRKGHYKGIDLFPECTTGMIWHAKPDPK